MALIVYSNAKLFYILSINRANASGPIRSYFLVRSQSTCMLISFLSSYTLFDAVYVLVYKAIKSKILSKHLLLWSES